MADVVDITDSNDFNEEKLTLHRNRKIQPVERGRCLFCKEQIKSPVEGDPIPLYCDDDCKEDFEREDLIRRKTNRMIQNRN